MRIYSLLGTCAALAIYSVCISNNAHAIENPSTAPDATNKSDVVIQFRIFDANEPSRSLQPDLDRRPLIFLRNLTTNKDELYLGNSNADITITPSADRPGFYEITLPKDRLINDMAIEIAEPNTNVAAITKIVTANNIVLYPGASNSLEKFTSAGFTAQLGVYQRLMTELSDQFYDRREEIRSYLRTRYAARLTDMQSVLDQNKVEFTRPEQKQAAREALNKVLDLYGIAPSVPIPPLKPQAIVNQYHYYYKRGLLGRYRHVKCEYSLGIESEQPRSHASP